MSTEFVAPEEWLSRYILQSNHIRKVDSTVKPEAFIPHPHEDLSVTRHLDLDQESIWSIGEGVALQRSKILYGRAINQGLTYVEHNLKVLPAPVSGNPNHANISGWPSTKEAQKIIAIEIAANSKYAPHR